MEGKAVVSPSLDHASFLPLPQENNSSVLKQVISEEIQQPSAEEHLPLQPVSRRIQPRFKLKSKQSQQKHLQPQSPTPDEYMRMQQLLALELPETPAPLPLIYSNTGASMPTDQTDEAQDDPPGRLQFAPLLRLSQGRANGKTPEA